MEIRFVAWLIWRIHLAFRQMGVGGGMGCQFALAFLKNVPFAVVLELAEASQEAFDWLAEHFPDVSHENPGLQRCALLILWTLVLSTCGTGFQSALAVSKESGTCRSAGIGEASLVELACRALSRRHLGEPTAAEVCYC